MPMLDIFSILITFLLMSYPTDPVSYNTNAGVELPESTTLAALDETPSIVVTKTEIKINDKIVSTVVAGDVPEKDRQQGAVYPVFQELEKLMEANKRALRGRLTEADKSKLSTLTMEISCRNSWPVSIFHAACRTMSRAAYSSMAESARGKATPWWSARRRPKFSRSTARCVAMSRARWATPIHRMA